jgi:L-fuconolactonase
MPVIDSHLHVWDPTRASYPWLSPGWAPINARMTIADAEPELRAHEVEGVILVQAADNAEDTANMLAVADQSCIVLGVVAWLPLADPNATAAGVEARDPRVVGIRTLIHDRLDLNWILRADVGEGLRVLEAAGLPYDYVTAGPDALMLLPTLAARYPDLTLVLDHLGKPPLKGEPGSIERWRRLLQHAAENPRLHAKVSGLYGSDAAVARVLEIALDVFGPERLMYGSDWPISLLHGGEEGGWSPQAPFLSRLSDDERNNLFRATATRVYGLARAAS